MDLLLKQPSTGTGVIDAIDGCPDVKYAYGRGGVYCRWFDGQRARVKSSRVPQLDVVDGRMARIIQHAKCLQTFYNEFNVKPEDVQQEEEAQPQDGSAGDDVTSS